MTIGEPFTLDEQSGIENIQSINSKRRGDEKLTKADISELGFQLGNLREAGEIIYNKVASLGDLQETPLRSHNRKSLATTALRVGHSF